MSVFHVGQASLSLWCRPDADLLVCPGYHPEAPSRSCAITPSSVTCASSSNTWASISGNFSRRSGRDAFQSRHPGLGLSDGQGRGSGIVGFWPTYDIHVRSVVSSMRPSPCWRTSACRLRRWPSATAGPQALRRPFHRQRERYELRAISRPAVQSLSRGAAWPVVGRYW